MALDLLPARIVAVGAPEFVSQPCDRLGDAAIVEIDALARDVADRQPVAGLEMTLGGCRTVAEQSVMPIEAVERGLGDGLRTRRLADAGNCFGRRGGMSRVYCTASFFVRPLFSASIFAFTSAV